MINWLQTVTGGDSFDDLMVEARVVPPGSDGLLVLPYLARERTPVFDPQARGVVAGLTLRHTRGHLFRAAYEGKAAKILLVRAPGCAPSDFWAYDYRRIPRPLWPWDEIDAWRPEPELFSPAQA